MPDIILTTLNARYAHCAFGLRYLFAYLGDLQPRARLLEFDISQRPLDVAETILAHQPQIVGLGVYVWNAEQSRQLVTTLKRLRPELIIVLGGPEVSYETEQQEICRLADYVITGEADLAFAELCRQLLSVCHPERSEGPRNHSTPQAHNDYAVIIPAPFSDLNHIALPYSLYADTDIAHRVIYVEASRGCPFECEFCLSSLDIPVRQFELDRFLPAMQTLLDRSYRQFKFVDRTFNLDIKSSAAILQFFLDRYVSGMFLHFEIIPDRLPEALRGLICQFPPGSLQFEVGIQTFNEEVAARISRRQDNAKAEANLRWLREQAGVHVHADLIVGLPGESLESFAAGFDRLVALRPQEIQVGILKRLRGAPIARHDTEWGMVYSPLPPYEILENKLIDFATVQRLRRFARYWDLIANSGRFADAVPLICGTVGPLTSAGEERTPREVTRPTSDSAFWGFLKFSDWLFAETHETHGIALARLTELLQRYTGKPITTKTGRDRQARHR